MLDIAAPNGRAESRVTTNAGVMSFTFQMDEEGGPWKSLTLPQGQLDVINRYMFAKLAVLQRNGKHPQDFPEMKGFPYTQYDWLYVNEALKRVDQRFASGMPYAAGILAYDQTHLYEYHPEFGGLDATKPFYGFNLAQVTLGEFKAIQQQLVNNKIPHVRSNYRPGASGEKHTPEEWEVIAYLTTRSDGKPVLSFVSHSEHDSGMLNASLSKQRKFHIERRDSIELTQQAMMDGVYINTIVPFLAKTVFSGDLALLFFEWK